MNFQSVSVTPALSKRLASQQYATDITNGDQRLDITATMHALLLLHFQNLRLRHFYGDARKSRKHNSLAPVVEELRDDPICRTPYLAFNHVVETDSLEKKRYAPGIICFCNTPRGQYKVEFTDSEVANAEQTLKNYFNCQSKDLREARRKLLPKGSIEMLNKDESRVV